MVDKYNIIGWKHHFAWGIDHKSSNSTSQVIKKIPFTLAAEAWIFIILLPKHSFYGLGIWLFGFR